MKIILPEKVKEIIKVLMAEGHEAYAVGGCVRDSLLSRIPEDWDITTSAKPLEVKRLFKRTIDTGIQHGTVTVMLGGEGFEVTTYRIDGEYEDSRHPKEVLFTSELSEDLRRRDFTINAMAYNDETGLVDLFGGREDLERGIIRAVGNPEERFTEDALRIMRAVRFAAQLNYDIEEKTAEAAKKLAANLKNISAERIRTELVKLMISEHPEKLRIAYQLGITNFILPEFDRMMETDQNHPHHIYSVGEHTIHAYCNIKCSEHTKQELAYLRLGLLLHDVGKPSCHTQDEDGTDHFRGHSESGIELTRNIMHRLKFDNKTTAAVLDIVKYHDVRLGLTYPKVRRVISRMGIDTFERMFFVRHSDIMAQSDYMREDKLENLRKSEEMYKKIREMQNPLFIKDLAINGKDLMDAGLCEGPGIGVMLNYLLAKVLDTPEKNTREKLLELAQNKMEDDEVILEHHDWGV